MMNNLLDSASFTTESLFWISIIIIFLAAFIAGYLSVKNGRKFYDINLVKVKYSVLKSYMDIFSKYKLDLSLITAEPFILPELLIDLILFYF